MANHAVGPVFYTKGIPDIKALRQLGKPKLLLIFDELLRCKVKGCFKPRRTIYVSSVLKVRCNLPARGMDSDKRGVAARTHTATRFSKGNLPRFVKSPVGFTRPKWDL